MSKLTILWWVMLGVAAIAALFILRDTTGAIIATILGGAAALVGTDSGRSKPRRGANTPYAGGEPSEEKSSVVVAVPPRTRPRRTGNRR